jgi:hypothetical protein
MSVKRILGVVIWLTAAGCAPLSFKTVLTTIFLDHGRPIAQIGKRPGAVPLQSYFLLPRSKFFPRWFT